MIKAIDTYYKGYKFRSRLEARWAVFFDSLGIKWEYEKEGYNLEGIYYLPDFWLPEVKMWVEVKPEEFNEDEINKVKLLAKLSECPVLMLIGTPDNKIYEVIKYHQDYDLEEFDMVNICDECGSENTHIEENGYGYRDCEDDNIPSSEYFAGFRYISCEDCNNLMYDIAIDSELIPLGERYFKIFNFDFATSFSNIAINTTIAVRAARSKRFEFGEQYG